MARFSSLSDWAKQEVIESCNCFVRAACDIAQNANNTFWKKDGSRHHIMLPSDAAGIQSVWCTEEILNMKMMHRFLKIAGARHLPIKDNQPWPQVPDGQRIIAFMMGFGSGTDAALAAAGWKLNVAITARTGDTSFAIANVRTDRTKLQNARFPVQYRELSGGHDGSSDDWAGFLLPKIGAFVAP